MSSPKASQMTGCPGSFLMTMPVQLPTPSQVIERPAVTSGSVVTPTGMATRKSVGFSPVSGSAGPTPCSTRAGEPAASAAQHRFQPCLGAGDRS